MKLSIFKEILNTHTLANYIQLGTSPINIAVFNSFNNDETSKEKKNNNKKHYIRDKQADG
jgi:hypothetical protein